MGSIKPPNSFWLYYRKQTSLSPTRSSLSSSGSAHVWASTKSTLPCTQAQRIDGEWISRMFPFVIIQSADASPSLSHQNALPIPSLGTVN